MRFLDKQDLTELVHFIEEHITKISVAGFLMILFFSYMIRINFFIEREPHWASAVRIECNVGDNKWVFEPAYEQNLYVGDDRIFFYYSGEYIQIKPLHLCKVVLIDENKYPQHYFNYYGDLIEK